MVKLPAVSIIGTGNIGSEVYRKVCKKGWDIACVVDIDGVFRGLPKSERIGNPKDYLRHIEGSDVAFLAIPTTDNGEIAFRYIGECLDNGVSVVTCEKGALSNYYLALERSIKNGRIGYSATVGGGTWMLGYAAERAGSRTESIHAVLNGTLNFIFESLENGMSLDRVVKEAQERGYAEPGMRNPLDIINKEAMDDVRMKAAILFNTCNLTKERARAKDIKTRPVTDSELKKLVQDASRRRYVVSFKPVESDDGLNAGFDYRVNKDWMISAKFRQVDCDLFGQLKSPEAGNAILIRENYGDSGRGDYTLRGPGAGAGPTANSMIRDAEDILGLR